MNENSTTTQPADNSNNQWQQEVLSKLVFASLNEQRRTRRWNIFFKAMFLAYLFILLAVVLISPGSSTSEHFGVGKHTALIDIKGVIAADAKASADHLLPALRAAFKDKNTQGIILRINSPGGSPVQSGYIYDEIKRLREQYKNIKVYAVITDIGASGAYYIASAADDIYADKASLVGSIGVIMNGFGFVGAMNKLGIERRLYTAGEHKGFLDPFSPQRKEETTHIKQVLADVHQQFINAVKQGRGKRLKNDPALFSGLIWSGEEGMQLGLVDGLGSSSYVAREIIKAEKIVDFTPHEEFFDRLSERLGTSISHSLLQQLGPSSAIQ
ncbi:MAG: S49 family peptidase [Gammaproteobacteria bacterium]|nr:S49 family peptidase [Gammaproteobacteria bacterium]